MRKIPIELLDEARKERPSGYVEDVLAHAEKVDDKYIYMECKTFMRLRAKWTPLSGPGSHLHAILEFLGFKVRPGCSCTERIVQMNIWGVEGCKKRFGTIKEWMAIEAKNRGVAFLSVAASALIRLAIFKASLEEKHAKAPPH